MRFIPIDELKADEILAVNVVNGKMQTLVSQGAKLTTSLINRIKKYGVSSVYIEDEKYTDLCCGTISDTIEPILRNHSINKIKTSIEKFEDKLNNQKKKLKYGDTGNELYSTVKTISGDLIHEILSAKNTRVVMQDIKSLTDYHHQHSVNVAVLSLIVGVEMGLSTKDLEDLAYGALLIDCGCQWLDKDLLISSNKYEKSEFNTVKEHVIKGYSHISDNTTFNAHVKSIIMHHHERVDGTGYPNELTAAEIHPLAKIVMIADVYDALTSDRPYRKAHSQNEAVEYIMAHADSKFDFEIAHLFARKVIPYPIGTYVELSNSQKGIVTENNPSHPMRPILRTFGKSNYTGSNNLQLNLLEHHNITINKIIYNLD